MLKLFYIEIVWVSYCWMHFNITLGKGRSKGWSQHRERHCLNIAYQNIGLKVFPVTNKWVTSGRKCPRERHLSRVLKTWRVLLTVVEELEIVWHLIRQLRAASSEMSGWVNGVQTDFHGELRDKWVKKVVGLRLIKSVSERRVIVLWKLYLFCSLWGIVRLTLGS